MEKDFASFPVSEVFPEIERGKRLKKVDQIPGNTPYVSSTAMNNGIDGFIEATPGTRVFGDCISLANSGSVGSAFYEPFTFVASDHVTHMKREGMNGNQYLYSACSIEKQGVNFNFNREINEARIKKMRIMLPVTNTGGPDYRYMSVFVESLKNRMLRRYKNYVAARLSNLQYRHIPELNKIKWGTFKIEDIFSISPGKRLEKRNMLSGNRPFIGASDNNNGVTAFADNENESLDKNVLGINYNGSVCEAFYHPYECIFSDDVKRLHLRYSTDNEAVLLFIGQMIYQQKRKYEYAYKFNEQRMKRQTIQLPIRDNGKPDYDYMEQYVKNLMIRKYEQYLAFADSREV